MKKLMFMIALVAISFSSVYAVTTVSSPKAVADTTMKMKKKKGVVKSKKKIKTKKDTVVNKM